MSGAIIAHKASLSVKPMPWDAGSFKSKHNKKLSKPQASKAAAIANAILKRTGDEGLAIRTANARAEGKPRKFGMLNA